MINICVLGLIGLATLGIAQSTPQGLNSSEVVTPLTPEMLGDTPSEKRKITCTGGPSPVKPYSDQCVNALLRIPFTAQVMEFSRQDTPKQKRQLPLKIDVERCRFYLDNIDTSRSDQASWLYVQQMAVLLVGTCKYAFGKESRTGGELIFGFNANLKMSMTKLPRPTGLSANATSDFDDSDTEDGPRSSESGSFDEPVDTFQKHR